MKDGGSPGVSQTVAGMDTAAKTAAILCSGGPAPGKNSLIKAIVEGMALQDWIVYGLLDGFESIMRGEPRMIALTPERVQGIGSLGGSIIGTSRANPTKSPSQVAETLSQLGVSLLFTIGGNDTLTGAAAVAKASNAALRVVHLPKTIDNDLPLEPEFNTFGFKTAVLEGSR
ncbi:MAG: 6-phosphofructokinase, partial [SAR324 cluster bacterium]|nr:6-phosphofructokinase [SAR324 cluster bacterium]